MRIAGIDIGSNTSLLLIVEKTEEGFEVLTDEIYFTRLAENIEQSSVLSESALSRLETAFASMRDILDKYQVSQLSIVATRAARQAENKERLFDLGEKYKISPIKIISPQREAELTFIGSFFGLGHNPSQPLVVDIGGGSTELVSSKKIWSLNMGSVSLTERFLSHKALSLDEKIPMIQHIQSQLKELQAFFDEDYDRLVFTAGTPTSLAFLEKQTDDFNQAHGLLLKEEQVIFWLEKLSRLNVEERKKLPYLPEHRADVIVAGLSLLWEILKRAGKKEFVVSAAGVRYGLVLEQFQKSI